MSFDMTELKRIQLTTVAPVEKDNKKTAPPKTIRINLNLKQSTDTTCPEFSYTDLTRNEVGDLSQDGSSTNPFGDDDDNDKMIAIAKAFEEKYAPKPKKCRKGVYRDHLEDMVDLGDGYDDDDPFIDNAEAYDEVVPVCMTTSLGGFYINSGMLDFKYQSEDSVDDFKSETPIKKKKKVKQITSDTDSEPGEKKTLLLKKRKLKEGIEGGMKKKKRLLTSDGNKIIKNKLVKKFKKKMSPTVAELLKDQSASMSPVEVTTNGDVSTRPVDGRGDASNPIIGSIDSLLEQAVKDDSSQDMEDVMKPSNPELIPPLPVNLPDSLAQTLNTIKLTAKKSGEGKCKFFTNEVNNILLSIEVSTRQLSCGQRSSIYAHLAAFLPCSKDTLLKRAKKLRLNEVDDKLRDPINKLREVVTTMMPALMKIYEAECQLTLLARQEGKEKVEGESKDKEDASTESDEDDKANNADGDKGKKRINVPRKKFEWNAEVRNCLLEVVKAKMLCYVMLKTRMQSPEEYLKAFLDAEVKPIWPQGWMQTRMLYKESRVSHSSWTNPQKQTKKAVVGSKSFTSSPGVVTTSVNKSVMNNGDKTPKSSNVIEISSDVLQQQNIPTILDYADYAEKISPTNKISPNISPNSNPQISSAMRPSSKPSSYSDISKVKDSTKHHLVSEILQKPLSVVTSSQAPSAQMTSSPISPHLSNPNPKESNFFMEFQKHLSKQLSPSSQEKIGYSSQTVTSTSPQSSGQFRSPTNKHVDTSTKSSLKVNEAKQRQYQAQMNKAQQQQARQAVTTQQIKKQNEQQLMAELQFQKAYLASVQSGKGSPQTTKQFSPQTTMSASTPSQVSPPSGRDQILAQIQAELGRGDAKLKFKQGESKTSQKIIEDAVMQQMFKQPLPANSTIQQKPLLQQALRASPVSSSGTSSVNVNPTRQSPSLALHPPGSRPMSSLLSPTSRGITSLDLTADSKPKNRSSPTHMIVKKTSPTNLSRLDLGPVSVSAPKFPGYVIASPASMSQSENVVDRSKVFLQPHYTQQSQARQTSLLNTSATSNKNMQAQWNAAFGVNSGKVNPSVFSPPASVSNTVSVSSKKVSDPSKTYLSSAPAKLSYNDVCEILGVQSTAAHPGSTISQQAALYSHSSPSTAYSTPPHNPSLLYHQQHSTSPTILSPSLQYGHMLYPDTSQKPHGQ